MGKIVIVFSKLFGGDAVLLNIYFVILLLSSSEQGEGYEGEGVTRNSSTHWANLFDDYNVPVS